MASLYCALRLPLSLYVVVFLYRGMPDIQWMNLDPLKLMEELSQFTSLEGFREMLDKAQVGHAYMNRPCLDPNDSDCPLSAPNKDLREVGWFHSPPSPFKEEGIFVSPMCLVVK